jgi:hypothetical protein
MIRGETMMKRFMLSLVFVLVITGTANAQHQNFDVQLLGAKSLFHAVNIVKNYFSTMNDAASVVPENNSNYAFMRWALRKMTYNELQSYPFVATFDNAVMYSEIVKGHKVCVDGIISKISVVPARNSTFGTIVLGPGKVLFFFDAGSDSILSEGAIVRYCGIATGLKYYQNENNDIERALFVVGMASK